jgi:hypothetical protein
MLRTRRASACLGVAILAVLLTAPAWAKLTDYFTNSTESAKRWAEARNAAQLSFSGGEMHLINQVGHGGITYEKDSARMWPTTTFKIRAKSADTAENNQQGGVLTFSLAQRMNLTDPLRDQRSPNGPAPKNGFTVDISFRTNHPWYITKFWNGNAGTAQSFGTPMTTWDVWHDIQIDVLATQVKIYADGSLIKTANMTIPADKERRIWLGVGYAQIDLDYIEVEGNDGIMRQPGAPVTLSAVPAPTRSGMTQLTLTLSTAAAVSVEIRNLAGRTVAVLPERALPAGVSSLSWTGRGVAGTAVPSGRYLAAIRAQAPGGSAATCLVPLQR